MEYSFSHVHTVRVRYSETDQMGYCYYGNYAQYFEIGRVEALRDLGISYRAMEDDGVMLPVVELLIKYLRPAYYDDELLIETFLTEITGARISFRHEIKNANNEITTTAETKLVFVDKESKRPTKAPEPLVRALSKFLKQ
jgi:acyl-CoA thioester hydrolase